nr:amidohydrolase family protein [Lachnospiraceae bacterium]
EEVLEAMRYTGELALTKGITTIHAQEGFTAADPAVPLLIENMDNFPVDLVIWWCMMPDPDDPICRKTGILGGDIMLDGSIGSRTASFTEKYEDGDGCGYLNFSDEDVYAFVEAGIMRDLAMSFHAIGEGGVHQALNAYEDILSKHPEKKDSARLRLEHFGWVMEEDMARAARLGVRISTQPAFTYLRGGPGSIYRSRLGEAREKAGYSLRRMLDYGLCVGGGSDSDITPLDSLLGIHAAVNQPYPENSVTPYEALRMYTSEGARSGWEDDFKGRLIPGFQADMTILGDDPLTCNPGAIKDIPVLATVRKGQIVYRNGI